MTEDAVGRERDGASQKLIANNSIVVERKLRPCKQDEATNQIPAAVIERSIIEEVSTRFRSGPHSIPIIHDDDIQLNLSLDHNNKQTP